MELPKIFSKPSDTEAAVVQLLVCYLTSDSVQAGLVTVEQGQIKFLQQSESLHYQGAESLVVQVDEGLRQLGKESENLDEVIFGFDNSWLDEKHALLSEKQTLVTKIKDELSLKAVASVVAGEAVLDYFSKSDSLVSRLMVEISHYMISVSLFQRGKFLGAEQVGKSGDIVADVHEALARLNSVLKSDHFPPSIGIVSAVEEEDDLQDHKASIMQYEWKSVLPFLHQPTVEILNSNMVIATIGHFGARNVALKRHINVSAPVPAQVVDAKSQANPDFGFAPAKIDPETETTAMSEKGDNFKQVNANVLNPEKEDDDIKADSYPKTAVADELGASGTVLSKEDDPFKSDDMGSGNSQLNQKKSKDHPHWPYISGGFVLGLLILWGISWWWIQNRVQLLFQLKLNDQLITKEIEVNLDPEATVVDVDTLTLPATPVQKSVSGAKTTQTTGIKLVGDEAKGKVEVWNKTSSQKTFPAGTVLKSGELAFVLDEEVQIASSSVTVSSDGTETKSYGKTQVGVTANQIGAESNLSKDKILSIESFSSDSYEAKVVDGLAGGNSKEIRIASETDRANLRDDLIKQLTETAALELSDESGGGVYFEPTGVSEVSSSKFDSDEGDEVETITLDMTLDVEAISYQSTDLYPLAIKVLEKELKAGYSLLDQDPDILSSPKESDKEGVVVLDVQVDGVGIPNIDFDVWRSEISGLPLEQAASVLKSKSEVNQVAIKVMPSIVGRFVKKVPSNLDLIDIQVTNE